MAEQLNMGMVAISIIGIIVLILFIFLAINYLVDKTDINNDEYIEQYQYYTQKAVEKCSSKRMEFVTVRKGVEWESICATISPYKIYVERVQE